MIRFLQTENRMTKGLLVLVIGAASVSMVVYLIPGLTGVGASSASTYAVIYPRWYNKFLSSGMTVTQEQVEKAARQQMARQRYPDNAAILGLVERQAGQQLVQQQVVLVEAEKLGIQANGDDVIQFLRSGPNGQVLFPNGQFIGDERYAAMIAEGRNQTGAGVGGGGGGGVL